MKFVIFDDLDDAYYNNPELREMDWECTAYQLDRFIKNQPGDLLLVADLGLWNGRRRGCATIQTYEEFIWHVVGRNSGYLSITEEDGRLKFEFAHHDGINEYELRLVTKKGQDWIYNNRYGGEWLDNPSHLATVKCYTRNANLIKWEESH